MTFGYLKIGSETKSTDERICLYESEDKFEPSFEPLTVENIELFMTLTSFGLFTSILAFICEVFHFFYKVRQNQKLFNKSLKIIYFH